MHFWELTWNWANGINCFKKNARWFIPHSKWQTQSREIYFLPLVQYIENADPPSPHRPRYSLCFEKQSIIPERARVSVSCSSQSDSGILWSVGSSYSTCQNAAPIPDNLDNWLRNLSNVASLKNHKILSAIPRISNCGSCGERHYAWQAFFDGLG